MLNVEKCCVLCSSCFCHVIGRTLICDITTRELWAETIMSQSNVPWERSLINGLILSFCSNNKHLEGLVVRDGDSWQTTTAENSSDMLPNSILLKLTRKNSFWPVHTQWRRLLHSLALPVTHQRQKQTVLRAADRISSLSLGRNGWKKSNVQISFHFFFVLVYPYVPGAKLCWVQSSACACGLFSSLSRLDWGTQLTRGCTHSPQTGAMTLVVAGE